MKGSMKIGGAIVGLGLAALVAAPLARHHLGIAEAQTHPERGIDPKIVQPLAIGMNLGGPSYFTSEEVFADPIKTRGTLFWETDPRGPLGDQLKLDDGGRPIDVPAGTRLSARIHDGLAPLITGTYRCTIAPGWRIEEAVGGQVSQSGTKFTVTVPAKGLTDKTVLVVMSAEKNGAALTELSCRYPGDRGNAIFRQDFLDDMKPFRVIRFMDWMATNNAPLRTWAQRTTPSSIEQIRHGMSVEYMVALANQLHSDPWFTLPLDVDQGYYRNFATYVRDHLDPGLKAYVELSNEVWNDTFQQAKDATQRGKKLYPGVSDDKANDYYYGDRVRELMSIWSDVFTGQRQRIVRVLGSMGWDLRTDQRLGHKETWKYVDAVAIAPYWGDVPNDVPSTGKARVEAVIAKTPGYIDQALAAGHASKVMAAKYGLPLITYEGGPGYWAYDQAMVKDMEEVSNDPRVYAYYQIFLRRWQKEIGGTLVLYQATAPTLFGHRQYTGQPLSEAPKMRAVLDFINQLPTAAPPRP
ncbi:hypothetical protein [Sphingomonas bacterium]|uniref:hypothetical protein n=1 Tax=Sphingomonas bacterium TaxID=1895847 RepID=UPI001575F6E9|nr:hypothetical protein [Sphingomonas bacterium]